jgi:hypothetical protein
MMMRWWNYCVKTLDHAMDILRRTDKIAATLLREQLAEPQFQNQT